MYALAKIRQVKYKRTVKKYACYDTRSHHASRRHRYQQCDFECLPLCDWASIILAFVIPFGCT